MKNKTKTKTNLKRALLFFIPLCLIAGMFAVPALAAVHVAWKNVDATTTLEPTTITDWRNGNVFPEADTSGMYAIVFDDLAADIREADPSSIVVDIFPGFTGVGYLEVAYSTVTYYYTFGSRLDTIANDIEVGIVYDPHHEDYGLSVGSFSGAITTVFVGGATCTFYFANYPPVEILGGDNAYGFWNAYASYNTYMVSEGSVTPDPEPPAGGDDDGGEGDTSGIFAVWTQITDWMIDGLKSATNAFYYNGQLTLLGYLCIIPLALGVALLLISIIQKFLRLRG